MPIEFRGSEAHLTGSCVAEDASDVAEWLAACERPSVNLAACGHLHTAVLQTLLAYKPAITAEPQDAFLSRWILPLLGSAGDPIGDSDTP